MYQENLPKQPEKALRKTSPAELVPSPPSSWQRWGTVPVLGWGLAQLSPSLQVGRVDAVKCHQGHGSFSLFLLDRAGITGGRRLEGSTSPAGNEIINVAIGFSWAQLFEKKPTQILLNIVKTSTNNFYTSLHQSTFFPFFYILFLTCDRCFKSWVWIYFCCISGITFKPLSMGDPSQWIFAISNVTPIFWFHFEGGNFVTVYQDPNQTDLYQAHVSHSFSLDLVGMLWFFFRFWHRAL